jgi:hypothetical protein
LLFPPRSSKLFLKEAHLKFSGMVIQTAKIEYHGHT